MLAFGVLPVGQTMIFALEQRFPSCDEAGGKPDGIGILGLGVVSAR